MQVQYLIKGGTVVDGTGRPAFKADVRIREGKIAEVAPDIAPEGRERVVDAKGCYVTPGFFENHNHWDGGIWWSPAAKAGEDSWGYGERVKSLDEFYTRFEGLFDALLSDPLMFGYCYTQLTDVYQEQNGIYTFDRRAKFDLDRIRAIQQRPAAIEG